MDSLVTLRDGNFACRIHSAVQSAIGEQQLVSLYVCSVRWLIVYKQKTSQTLKILIWNCFSFISNFIMNFLCFYEQSWNFENFDKKKYVGRIHTLFPHIRPPLNNTSTFMYCDLCMKGPEKKTEWDLRGSTDLDENSTITNTSSQNKRRKIQRLPFLIHCQTLFDFLSEKTRVQN